MPQLSLSSQHGLPKEEITLLMKGNYTVTDVVCLLNYLHHGIPLNNSHFRLTAPLYFTTAKWLKIKSSLVIWKQKAGRRHIAPHRHSYTNWFRQCSGRKKERHVWGEQLHKGQQHMWSLDLCAGKKKLTLCFLPARQLLMANDIAWRGKCCLCVCVCFWKKEWSNLHGIDTQHTAALLGATQYGC